MRRSFFALAFIVFFSFCAQAQTDVSSESIFTGANPSGEKVFLIRYQEGPVWRVDEIVQHADGWQDLVSSHEYSSSAEAAHAQLQLKHRFSSAQVMIPFDKQVSGNDRVLSGGSLWPTTESWSWEWEIKYAQWLMANMTTDFFQKYNFATDCADVVYSSRWIFARIHGLPAANRLSGTNSLFTNQSLRSEWQKLPTAANWYEDQRFLAALNYLLDNTYTHSLKDDSYPIAITPEFFLPGAHHIDIRAASGHAQLVHRVDLSDAAMVPYMIIQSTIPRKVRILSESMSWGSEQAKIGVNGFMRLVWPRVENGTYSLEKPENMPGYSLEQYAPDFIRQKDRPNYLEVLLRLKPNVNFVSVVKSGYADLIAMIKTRAALVKEGFGHCPNRSCSPESRAFDDWSTPSRDKKIKDTIQQLGMISSLPLPEDVHREIRDIVVKAYGTEVLSFYGETYQLRSLIFSWINQLYSSDPNDEPSVRWGITPESFSLKIQNDFAKHFEARKIKVTVEADNTLRGYLGMINSYCLFFSEAQCQRFKTQELKKPVQLLGQTRSLQEWLEFSLWLNSDEQQSPANQWGALQATSKFQPLPEDVESFFVPKAGLGFLNTKTQTQVGVMGTRGLIPAALPPGYSWLAASRATSVGWAFKPGSLLRHDFINRTKAEYAVPQLRTAKIIRALSKHLWVESGGQLWSLHLRDNQIVVLWKGAVKNGHMDGEYYFYENAGSGRLIDLSQAIPKVLSVPGNPAHAKIFKSNKSYIGVEINPKRYIVETATGVVRDVSALGLLGFWSDGFSRVLVFNYSDGSILNVVLDKKFNIVSKQKIGERVLFIDNMAIVKSASGSMRVYQLVGEELKETELQADEGGIRDWKMPWIVTGLKDKGQFRLRQLDGSQILYEGGPFVMAGNQVAPEWIYRGAPGDRNLKLVSLKNPQGPAYRKGQFTAVEEGTFVSAGIFPASVSADRGLLLNYQGFKFWVEF